MDKENRYGILERQKTLLDMMKKVALFLKEHNIRYSLCAGTLIGAVRHNGFIPWDDDIDIMVDREQYEKLIEAFQNNESEFALRRILWVYRIQNKDVKTRSLKEPTIDVFVMDACPKNKVARKLKVFLIRTLQGMMKEDTDYSQYSPIWRLCLRITHLLGLLLPYNTKFNLYDRIAKMGPKKNTEYITAYTDTFRAQRLRHKASIMESIEEHPFEDTTLPIISDYDSYLTTLYGDYMTPPPEDKRQAIHV